MTPLQPATLRDITRIFDSLDYQTLGPVYCDEGGDAFWEERRGPCPEPRTTPAPPPRHPPPPGGPGPYVGAGPARPPPPAMETTQPHPTVPASQPAHPA